jgi:hypothetical protein
LFPDEDRRRAAVRKLVQVAGKEIVLFCIADQQLRAVVLCQSDRRAGLIGRSILRATRSLAAALLGSPDIEPVESRAHLERLVRHHLEQMVRRDVVAPNADPALWSGSCFQDMVGARVIEGLELQTARMLPRFRLQRAYEHVGLPPVLLTPLDDHRVRAVGTVRIIAAAAAAVAAPARLENRSATTVLARRAAVQTASSVGIPTTELAWALRTTLQTVRRLKIPPVDERVLRAVRMRLALENARALSLPG